MYRIQASVPDYTFQPGKRIRVIEDTIRVAFGNIGEIISSADHYMGSGWWVKLDGWKHQQHLYDHQMALID